MKIHVFVSKLGSLISFPFAPAVHRTYMVTQRYVFSNGSQSTGTALAINLLGTPGLTPKSRTHTLNKYILKLTVTSQPGLKFTVTHQKKNSFNFTQKYSIGKKRHWMDIVILFSVILFSPYCFYQLIELKKVYFYKYDTMYVFYVKKRKEKNSIISVHTICR